MPNCEACGKQVRYRHTCNYCERKICPACEPVQGYFCTHGTVRAVPIDDIDELQIVAIKDYSRWKHLGK